MTRVPRVVGWWQTAPELKLLNSDRLPKLQIIEQPPSADVTVGVVTINRIFVRGRVSSVVAPGQILYSIFKIAKM